MSPGIATVVCGIVVLGLFWLDRDQKARTSGALWIPVVWLSLAGSRSVTQWLQTADPMTSPDQVLEGSPMDALVYMGLLAVGLVALLNRRSQVATLLRANGPILLFFCYCAVSLLWSDFPDVAFKRWTKALGDFVMVLLVLSDREPAAAVKRLLGRATYLLIPLSILFIKYYPDLGRGYSHWDGGAIYTGVATNKNTLGVICLFFGLGSLWRLLAAYRDREGTGRTRQLIAHGAVLAMVLWLFWMANSMTSFSCFLLASGLLLATNCRAVVRKPAVVHLLVAAVLSVSVSIVFLGLSPGVLDAMGRDPTLTDRTEVWSVVIGMVTDPLLGTGFESFWLGPRLKKLWSIYSWRPWQAHNGYIEIFVNLGWTGVALLAVVMTTGYRTVVGAYRRNLPTGSLSLAYFVVGVVYNFTEAAFFRMMAPAWILFLLVITSAPPVLPSPKTRTSVGRGQGHEMTPSDGDGSMRRVRDEACPVADGSCDGGASRVLTSTSRETTGIVKCREHVSIKSQAIEPENGNRWWVS
jgi:O-antigen ligase